MHLMEKKTNLARIVARWEVVSLVLSNVQGSERQQKGQSLFLGCGLSQIQGDERSSAGILILVGGPGLHGCGSHDDTVFSMSSRYLSPEKFFFPFS